MRYCCIVSSPRRTFSFSFSFSNSVSLGAAAGAAAGREEVIAALTEEAKRLREERASLTQAIGALQRQVALAQPQGLRGGGDSSLR